MGLIKLTTSLVLITLFSIAIVGFSINFAIDNDSPINIGDDDDIDNIYDQDINNITEFFGEANASTDALITSTLDQGDETTVSGGQFKVGGGTMIKMAENSMSAGYKKLFGEDTGLGIFLTALIGLLTFIAGAYIYKAWIGRNPD